jgi:murein L,D-transpeptidase YafK
MYRIVLVLWVSFLGVFCIRAHGQAEPTNYKVLCEKKDKYGNTVREIEYFENGYRKIQTTILPPFPSLKERKPINIDTLVKDSLMIFVDKEQHLLAVLYKRKRIRQYRAVFGPDRTKDKMMMGDRKTPEGWFKIVSKKDHSTWQKFILLDYPNADSYKKFNERKKQKLIPANAAIGHSVGIHGVFRGGENMIDMGIGWTDGCVALKPEDIEDLYRFCFPGVRVFIKSMND